MLIFKLPLCFAANIPIKLILVGKFIPFIDFGCLQTQEDSNALFYIWAALEGFLHNCEVTKLRWDSGTLTQASKVT